MRLTRNLRILTATAALTALAACGGDTAPEDETSLDGVEIEAADTSDPATAVKERQAKFEEIGDAFKAIRGQLESDAPDMGTISEAAVTINQNSQSVASLFPAGSSVDDGLETEALATIWEKPEEFEAARLKLMDTSGELISAATDGNVDAVKAQVGAVGLSCKGCHDEFRLDTD